MRIRSVRRERGPARRAGALLAMILTVLVHLLACAHGSAPEGADRADALLVVSGSSCAPGGQHEAAASRMRGLNPTRDHGGHCQGLDQPTVQPPRAVTLAAAFHTLVPADSVERRPAPPGERPCRHPAPPLASAQRECARLGVWRT
ncbi:hypothetical protein [Streptomyces sp. NPDC004324]